MKSLTDLINEEELCRFLTEAEVGSELIYTHFNGNKYRLVVIEHTDELGCERREIEMELISNG